MKFCFIPVTIPDGQGVVIEFIQAHVERRLEAKRTYPRFADVPVKPRTLVLRIDRIKGRKTEVFEVAHSKVSTIDGKRTVWYRSSYFRKNIVQFLL